MARLNSPGYFSAWRNRFWVSNVTLQTKATLVILASPLVACALVQLAGSNGVLVAGVPLFAICIGVAFFSQWLAFIPAYIYQSEHYFDLAGSTTYVALALIALVLGSGGDLRSTLLGIVIICWASRLGVFLFLRVRKKGSDSRFIDIIPDFRVYLLTWTLQAMWISITASCALLAMTSLNKIPFDGWALSGLVLWVLGFVIEVTADRQKQLFRGQPENAKRFITTGLWAFSRHPNYLGEMMLWTGVALIAFPVLMGWQLISLLSPLFVLFMLTKVSGIDMQERQNDRDWGDDPVYIKYKANTPMLFPLTRPSGL